LESSLRAKKRQEFDEIVHAKKLEIEQQQLHAHKQNEDQENQELHVMRRKSIEEGGLMFKAKPIQKDDLYPAKYVSKAFEPTIPRSPKLLLRERKGGNKMTNQLASAVQGDKTKPAMTLRNF
jgi:hypothetical protein